jgi:hypothetical protein
VLAELDSGAPHTSFPRDPQAGDAEKAQVVPDRLFRCAEPFSVGTQLSPEFLGYGKSLKGTPKLCRTSPEKCGLGPCSQAESLLQDFTRGQRLCRTERAIVNEIACDASQP